MIIKLAILLAIVLIVTAFATWAFLPARHLPGNRARHLRIRLHLRLHPGKGFAHVFSLWLLRVALAPASTLAGFRAWVVAECPVAPRSRPATAPHPRNATKARNRAVLVAERHGSLASIPVHRVAGISADLAPQLNLNVGAARTALRKAVLAARNGDPR